MRSWHEGVAWLGDLVPGGVPVLGLLALFAAGLTALLWYFWPDWLPQWPARSAQRSGARGRRWWRRLPGPRAWRAGIRLRWSRRRWRLRWAWRLRWRRRRRQPRAAAPPADALPQLPAATLVLSADELAAQGHYREAVRERLRAIVRELVERELLDYRPGWTVTELAAEAGRVRPSLAGPLAAASDTFSGIWYGYRPAGPADDAAMRECAAQVRADLAPVQVAG